MLYLTPFYQKVKLFELADFKFENSHIINEYKMRKERKRRKIRNRRINFHEEQAFFSHACTYYYYYYYNY